MAYPPFHFTGLVQVYLQGREALELSTDSAIGLPPISYYVGQPASGILIHDYRAAPMAAAWLALDGHEHEADDFADIFNQPAWIEINTSVDQIEIELHDGEMDDKQPYLWLGVLHDQYMPAHDMQWEVLRPVGGNRIAFAALVTPPTVRPSRPTRQVWSNGYATP